MAETEQFLVAQDVYLKAGIHIGTKFRTKYMEQFIYKTRPDGLSVLNLQRIDERIRQAANLFSNYKPDDIIIVGKRENSWKAIRALNRYTGIKIFAGRYLPGILTNPVLDTYVEGKIVMVTDPWPDRNVIDDAVKVGLPVVALCDTNNNANNVDLVIPCNNKGKKSLGLIFWILAREYLKKTGKIQTDEEFKAPLEEFTEE